MCVCGVLKNQQDFEELEQKGRLILVTGKNRGGRFEKKLGVEIR